MKRISWRIAVLISLAATIALAHGGMRELKGTIVSVAPKSIVVKHLDGTDETIALTKATVYRVGRASGVWEDMRAGSRVVVHFGPDGKALEIHLPAKK